MAETFLERIVAATRQRVAASKAELSLDVLAAQAEKAPSPRAFAHALRPTRLGPAKLIAEVKRASPSKGLLAQVFDPVAQARAYEAGGAAAISVLTEPHFFLGSLEHLRSIRATVNIPVLCKDFILDEYQVYQARAAGADAILLICVMLDERQIAKLYHLARQLGMDTLIEIHNAVELERALRLNASVIGVNSRDLETFAVDTNVVRRLRQQIPMSSILVAESGITDRLHATQARAWGADAILVGEALMHAPDAAGLANVLATASGGTFSYLFGRSKAPFVKLCGLSQPEHGALAAQLGANAIGLIFAPSHRQINSKQARLVIQSAEGCLAVGVFVNESPTTITSIALSAGLGAIQLSGDETPDVCSEIAALTHLPVIKAFRPQSESKPEALDVHALAGAALLLDTPSTDGSYGGTGLTGNWKQARHMAERWPIIISGGLTPENVAAALATMEPIGVDSSSGIETNGAKDSEKMRDFVRRAHGTECVDALDITDTTRVLEPPEAEEASTS